MPIWRPNLLKKKNNMGNEASVIKKCTISSKVRHSTAEWSMYDASYNNQQYSLFLFNDEHNYNDITRWKHIRHPNLVKCYEAGLYKNKPCILTESITPAKTLFDQMHEQRKLSGLYNIGEALSFLHQVCGISVNNIMADSIFVSRNDCNEIWKLGSLYWYSSLDSDSEEFFRRLIGFHTTHGTITKLPPEDREMSSHLLIRSSKLVHRRDSYAFASLIGELLYDATKPPRLADIILAAENDICDFNLAVKSFVDAAHSTIPDMRPTIANLLNNKLFVNCDFLQIRKFFINFGTHTDFEKERFVETLIKRLRTLPDPQLVVNIFTMIVSSRLIMSNQFIYKHVMPYFLIPYANGDKNLSTTSKTPNDDKIVIDDSNAQSDLRNNTQIDHERSFVLTNGQVASLIPFVSSNVFRDCIIPHISNLYCVHDYKIRVLLLLYLPHYASLIPKDCLRKIILPQILLGIKDADNELVSLTFRALAVLVDTFGVVAVLGCSKRPHYFATGISRDSRLSSQTDQNGSTTSTVSAAISTADKNSIDERDNMSASSCKSYSSIPNFVNYQIHSHLISERSSPDGDEINSNTVDGLQNSPVSRLNASNLNLVEDEDEWPEWENGGDLSSNNGFETAMESIASSETAFESTIPIGNSSDSSSSVSSKNVRKETLRNSLKIAEKSAMQPTSKKKVHPNFDIKEIDFAETNNNEIDNLFLDMQPVLNFSQTKSKIVQSYTDDDRQQSVQSSSSSTRERVNDLLALFVPKHDDDFDADQIAGSAWNEDKLEWNDDDEESKTNLST